MQHRYPFPGVRTLLAITVVSLAGCASLTPTQPDAKEAKAKAATTNETMRASHASAGCPLPPLNIQAAAWPAYAPLPGSAVVSPTYAAERNLLARIEHELALLERLTTQAAGAANPAAVHQFRYDWLVRDLDMARQGIRAHLNNAPSAPREFPPLRGDYQR